LELNKDLGGKRDWGGVLRERAMSKVGSMGLVGVLFFFPPNVFMVFFFFAFFEKIFGKNF
jgi:hypothetical protein